MIPIWLGIIIGVVCFLLGGALMFFIPFIRNNFAKNNAKKIIRDAEIKAEHITKNAQIDGKQTINEMKQEANREIHERKQEIQQQEKSLQQREQSIDRRDAALLAKENALDEKNETLSFIPTSLNKNLCIAGSFSSAFANLWSSQRMTGLSGL